MTQIVQTALIDPVRLHWRGEAALWPAILINLLGLTLLLGSIQDALLGAADVLVLAFVAVHCGPILIWQTIGYLRSASTCLSNGGDVFLTWGGYAMLLVVIAMTLSQSFGSVLSVTYFAPRASAGDLDLSLPVSKDGRDVFLTGTIDYRSRDSLRRTLEANPNVQRVVLASEGGLVFAARTVADIVLTQALDTHVEAQCNSACTLVFAAGRNRTLGDEGRLGFHAYGKASRFHLLTVDAVDEQAKDAGFLRQRGVSDVFLARIYTDAIDTLWQPDRQVLFQAGVLTEP